jgi:hypothetical protein
MTNNAHELKYKQLKHLLRKIIGFSAANCFLLSHGERIAFVNPAETYDGIRQILLEMDVLDARKRIIAERNSRDALSIIMHDVKKWEEKMNQLAAELENLLEAKPTIN